MSITETNPVTGKEQRLPMIDLSHLMHDQKPVTDTLLRENCN